MNTLRSSRLLVRISLITALLSITSLGMPALAGGRPDCWNENLVGTYLFDGAITGGTVPGGAPGLPPFLVDLEWQALMSLHADGTVTARHSFGPPGNNIEPALGVWKRTGRNSIKVMYLFFVVPRLEPGVIAEQHIQTGRVTLHLTIDRKLRILEGTFINEVFLAAHDPLDPAQPPTATVSGTIANARPALL